MTLYSGTALLKEGYFMKSCKKITSAVIALVLMFSALTCVSYAQPDETASSVTSSTWYGPEDMTYGYTKPQPTFTLPEADLHRV